MAWRRLYTTGRRDRTSRYEFLRLLDAARDAVLQKLDEAHRIITLAEEEVEAVAELFDLHRRGLRVLLEDGLFEVEEGSLVRNSLPHLDRGRPGEVLELLAAVRALLIAHDKFAIEGLLQYSSRSHFLLDGQSNLQSHTMRFRPDPGRVGHPYPLETSDTFKTNGHQFSTFWFAGDIGRRAAAVALAPTTLKQLAVRADALGDVRARLQAIDARHRGMCSRV